MILAMASAVLVEMKGGEKGELLLVLQPPGEGDGDKARGVDEHWTNPEMLGSGQKSQMSPVGGGRRPGSVKECLNH